ncbi:MAG: hypothetical protein MR601_05330 [Erysipelotrichaceae bacterium]|nr:hypothetical protein [Erysipelotrichaceae bacterium]
MTETRRRVSRKKAKRRSLSVSSIILIFGSLLIITPFIVLGWILLSASLDTGTPILGDRYVGDLDPAISKSDISNVKKSVDGINGVEASSVELATATLRVYVDVEDSYSDTQASDVAKSAYDSVINVLDVNKYFTQTDSKKMYDLEIHVYNLKKNRDQDNFSYVILTKTSSMSDSKIQVVSTPIDAELAQQLRDDVEARNNPTPKTEEKNEEKLVGEEAETPQETEKTE